MANREISFSQVNDDVVRSLVVTGRKYYITLAISILVTCVCFFWALVLSTSVWNWRGRNESSNCLGHLSC